MELRLDYHSVTPLYLQIADQLRERIATGEVKPGERLPPIRALSQTLNVNPNTVARAYLELEQERVIVSRRGGGTTVAARGGEPGLQATRQKRLLEAVNEDVVHSLSQGYSPEELEAAFYLSLERWREERRAQAEELAAPPASATGKVIRIVGSHDLALSILLDLLRNRDAELTFDVIHAGSLGGLIALQEERADLAGTHLLDEETGEYNDPYVKRILTGRRMVIINLVYRIQGLIYASGNPKHIKTLADLLRPEVTFVNRQKGSGTRVLLDLRLKNDGLDPSKIKGYAMELDTHLAVASHVSRGQADAGLGIEAAARSNNLGFTPLFRERYDLVLPREVYDEPRMAALIETIPSAEFKAIIDRVGGYDTSHTGETRFID